MTDEEKFREMAAQLRKPDGEGGLQTADWMSKGNVHIIHDTLKILDAGPGDQILEIGMGNGFFVPEIMEKSESIQYTGCDISALMVQESEKLNAGLVSAGRATFILSNITSLPFEKDVFNKIFTINTIYFWDDEVAALQEIRRVLQPNGQFIIGFRPKHQSEKYPFTKFGFNQFSKTDVSELLTKNGFTVLDIFENIEPDFELNGQVMHMENVVIVAGKI